MSAPALVSVAIPTRNAGAGFAAVLQAIRDQVLDASIEVVVVDSGSTDGTPELAESMGAQVERILPSAFSHGGTRNTLMELAGGDRVAFLSQDAEPAGPRWLAGLLEGLRAAPDVGLAYGPYRPRPGASLPVAHDLVGWFDELSSTGSIRIDRARPDIPTRSTHPANFFTSANGCLAREAWLRVPFPDIPYAEDRLLASRMLEAGFAKAYVPSATVLHSHDYNLRQLFRRAFDEADALRAVYGQREPLRPDRMTREILDGIRGDLAWRTSSGGLATSVAFHSVRVAGRGLGSRARRIPRRVRRILSLEGRG